MTAPTIQRPFSTGARDDLEMKHPRVERANHVFSDAANATSRAAGRALTFVLAVSVIVVWAITGPIFGYSDTWQLVINTGTTIVTFLMVFLIQNSQNRDSAAIQVKLDELVRVSTAKNAFVGIEHLTDKELDELRDKCEGRAKAESTGDEAVRRTNRSAKHLSSVCRPKQALFTNKGVNHG